MAGILSIDIRIKIIFELENQFSEPSPTNRATESLPFGRRNPLNLKNTEEVSKSRWDKQYSKSKINAFLGVFKHRQTS